MKQTKMTNSEIIAYALAPLAPIDCEHDDVMTADTTAVAILKGMSEKQFMILPHAELATYAQRKGEDYDRWLKGMRRMRRGLIEQHPDYDYDR